MHYDKPATKVASTYLEQEERLYNSDDLDRFYSVVENWSNNNEVSHGDFRFLADMYDEYGVTTSYPLYRVETNEEQAADYINNLEVGDTIKLNGVAGFSSILLEVDIPVAGYVVLKLDKGARALPLNMMGAHAMPYEDEHLVGGTLRVTKRTYRDADEMYLIYVEQVTNRSAAGTTKQAWNNPEQAQSGEEARERFGDEFVDAVKDWKDGGESPDSPLLRYHKERSQTAPTLYRGVRLDSPLEVGDTYASTGLDSWTEGRAVADDFAFTFGSEEEERPYPTILRLNDGGKGLSIDRWNDEWGDDEIRQEGEWLLDGNYEVTGKEDIPGFGGEPIGTLVDVRRKMAWDNPEPAYSTEEARNRFGDKFIDAVTDWKASGGGWKNLDAAKTLSDYHAKYQEPTPEIYRGVALPNELKVGDTYSARGLESWTEDRDIADYFSGGAYTDYDEFYGAVLQIPNGEGKGLRIDRMSPDADSVPYSDEAEWLVDGDYEVTGVTEGDQNSDYPYPTYTLKRKAWNNPEPAKTEEEARERFGDDFFESVDNWKFDADFWDESFQDSTVDYSEHHRKSPALYRGISLEQPLKVGDIYKTRGKYDSWTENKGTAEEFGYYSTGYDGIFPHILHLPEGGSGLPIDQMISGENSHEAEWLIGGDYDVVEDLGTTEVNGYPVNNFRLKRRAWNNPEPAEDRDEAYQRFGQDFTESVYTWKDNYNSGDEPFQDSGEDYSEHHRKSPTLYRGVALDEPLKVGDTYETRGKYDSWTEDKGTASLFALVDTTKYYIPSKHETVLHLPGGESGLPIDRMISGGNSSEKEWLLGGNYEVAEDLGKTEVGGSPINNYRLKRKAASEDWSLMAEVIGVLIDAGFPMTEAQTNGSGLTVRRSLGGYEIVYQPLLDIRNTYNTANTMVVSDTMDSVQLLIEDTFGTVGKRTTYDRYLVNLDRLRESLT